MKSELEKLIELQKTDTNIRNLKKAIESAEQRRASLEREFEQHAFSIREIQAKRDNANIKRTELEKQIAENKIFVERSNRNLKNAQNQKEYETAMRETDNLQKQISTLETQVLEQMTEIEDVEKILAERADEINSLDSNQKEALKKFDAEFDKNKKEEAIESQKREQVFQTLPPQMASIYNRLAQRSRDGVAVAEVINGSCSACFMSLRPQVQVELKTTDVIITCENCTRILYVAPEPKAMTQDL